MKILVEKDTKLAKFCLYDDQKVTLNKKTDMHGITVFNRNSIPTNVSAAYVVVSKLDNDIIEPLEP